MFYQKTDEYSKCRKCGKENDTNYIVIATGYEPKSLLRKESVKEVTSLCMTCGKQKLTEIIENLNCPIWIGIPKTENMLGKRNPAINFRPEIIP